MFKTGFIVSAIFAAIMAFAPIHSASADDGPPPMTFTIIHVSPLYDAVYGNGTIAADTTDVFNKFMQATPVRAGTTLFFNSPGGDLGSGITLGQAIRKAALNTNVGIPAAGTIVSQPAMCASACTFAYLGGVERTMVPKSLYGVHRFELTSTVKNVEKKTQRIAGILVNYIGEMGVSQQMYALSTVDGNDEKTVEKQVLWLDTQTMSDLKITTSEQIKAAIVERNGTAVLMVKDIEGAYEYGELDFYCEGNILVARGYFTKPASNFAANTPLTVTWLASGTNAAAPTSSVSVVVPSGQYRLVTPAATDQQMAVDVEVTPQTLNTLLPAKAVTLEVRGPSSYIGFDGVGAGNTLPTKVRTLLKALSSCS